MKKILFIDTLTTGMNTERCAIYRIGGIYTEDGVEKKMFDIKSKPFDSARINDTSLWLSGETRSSLLDFPEESKAFGNFINFLDTCVNVQDADDKIYIGGYNCSCFDIPFLVEWFRRNRNEQFRNYFHVQCFDTMNISLMLLADKRGSMESYTQDCVADTLGIEHDYEEASFCIKNARLSYDIWKKLCKEFGLKEYEDTEKTDVIIKNY